MFPYTNIIFHKKKKLLLFKDLLKSPKNLPTKIIFYFIMTPSNKPRMLQTLTKFYLQPQNSMIETLVSR